ncbi:MAG: JAB domain-containing protein [Dehalococcoidia bacterium]|nr:JAB domain-containing protein [Dehalococcoidia bacterium]
MHRIPVLRCCLVREGSHQTETRSFKTAATAAAVLSAHLEGADREHFVVILLDSKNKGIGINTVSVGSLNACIVHPREVFKPAILVGANAIILGHNHPSGDPTPSPEDVAVTVRIREVGRILGIEVLDHVIVAPGGAYRSLREGDCTGW